ncbi:glycoside hydrolase family 108 protein [Bosea sp. (in: a-proteobacteria)]|uniref:glycoside hydrolase family 108 protein n=1 Tax=Bosea sp. (in: a-proteobacteria) TaxID=1871050 RepID=UPI001AC6E7C4|nr:glycoside hydrolase family 108 protein [Bosea sp. (in: a-proteobacteria)]MBN9444399.1 glycoside hydrolase family 108 protein [Bosea sp. (in: a-proteobacteria)]
MTAQNYARALSRVLVHEGGYSNHPEDPGGATMKGVTQRVYDAYRDRRGLKRQSVRMIDESELQEIYRRQFWNVVKGDKLPAGFDYIVMDGAVHSGPSQSVKWLQRALGTVKVDGVIGEATLAAVEEHPDHDQLIAATLSRRLAFLKALKTWKTFKGGWSSRVEQVQDIGQAWATGSVGPQPVFFLGGNVKATIDQAKPLPAKGPADATAGAGGGSVGLAAVLDQVREQLDPLAAGSEIIGHVVAALVITGAVLTIGGIGYRFFAARRAKKRADALDLPDGVTA